MSTPTIHGPAGLEAETIVYSTAYEANGPGCVICGQPVAYRTDQQRYCSRNHKKYAARIRNGKKPGALPVDPPAGTCHYCGGPLPRRKAKPRRTCSRSACEEAFAARGFRAFRRIVKWPHPLSWLGPKINLALDDPRLPKLALALAAKGKLGVYVRADGSVGEVGRLKVAKEAEQ